MPYIANFAGVSQGSVAIRKLRDSAADIEVMLTWLTDPQVLAYWDGRDHPYTEGMIREKFIARIEGDIVPCLVEHDGQPIGYLQFYPVPADEGVDLYGYTSVAGMWGLDQFIGAPEYWNRGIGTAMVRLIVAYLFEHHGAERVILDPAVENARAIRCYEKAGFRKVKVIPNREFHEGRWLDSWLMEIRNPKL